MCISCLSIIATAIRGRGGFVRTAAAIGVVLLLMAAAACPVQAELARIDGDCVYLTEDFESMHGETESLGYQPLWGNAIAVDAGDLWYPFTHTIKPGYGEITPNPSFFPYLMPGHSDLQFAIVDNEPPAGQPATPHDGWGLLLRAGYCDLITFLPRMDILEFSCDVYLGDTFLQSPSDDHAIDFIGTGGTLRYLLPFDTLSQHVVITRPMFFDFIGELEAVRLESRYAVFDNLTVKSWLVGPPDTPEPGVVTLLGGVCFFWLLRRSRRMR